MANVVLSALISVIITFLISYSFQFVNMHDEYRDLGYLNHLYENSNMIFGLLIGSFMGLFFAITPMLLKLPSITKNILTQLHMSDTPIKAIGRVINVEIENNITLITVSYSGYSKTFSVDRKLVEDEFDEGDQIVVFYDKEDKKKSYLDIFYKNQNTNEIKNQNSDKTVFKLIDISPNYELGLDFYEITGEIFGREYNGKKAKFSHPFYNKDLSTLTPGRVIPCTIEGTGNDLSISLNLE